MATGFRAALLVVAAAAAGCSGSGTSVQAGGSPPPSTTGFAAAKLPDSIADLVARVVAGNRSGGDASTLSTPLLHVRSDGRIEVVISSAAPIDAAQQADLSALGAQVEGPLRSGAVQAWVPADKVADVAALAWVAGIAAPSYSTTGG